MQIDPTNKAIIDLESIPSPAVLAGILDIPVPMVHQGRQDGKLPPRTDATYRECIHRYIEYYKSKVNSRATTMGEAKLEQDIRNGIAKEHLQWLEVKKNKEELLELAVVKDFFEPVFHIINSSLVNLARKYPSIMPEIDNMLSSLYDLGNKIEQKATIDGDNFVKTMLENQVEIPEAEEAVLNAFGLNELL